MIVVSKLTSKLRIGEKIGLGFGLVGLLFLLVIWRYHHTLQGALDNYRVLQEVYEAILREPVDKRNFRKRVLSLGQIEETGELRRDGPHRPAKLYRVLDRNQVQIIK